MMADVDAFTRRHGPLLLDPRLPSDAARHLAAADQRPPNQRPPVQALAATKPIIRTDADLVNHLWVKLLLAIGPFVKI
jgi:hypothetical protein